MANKHVDSMLVNGSKLDELIRSPCKSPVCKISALSAVIQMVLVSLPYTLHSPTGTRHSIHLTPELAPE